jgi:hypothetical protein
MKFSITPLAVSLLALSAHAAPNAISEAPEIRAEETAIGFQLVTPTNFNQTQGTSWALNLSLHLVARQVG